MPKKRHQSNFSKPQTTAPASLGASIVRPTSSETQTKGVNELLASLRRATLASSNHPSASPSFGSPSSPGTPGTLPPSLRQILQIPETPPPPPRRPVRRDANGRRFPPGPRPPRSWVEQRVRNVASSVSRRPLGRGDRAHFRRMPGSHLPDRGSMTDLVLRRMAMDWEFQSVYDQHYLHTLHSRLRSALIAYVGVWGDRGISPQDLRSIILPLASAQEGEGGRYPSPTASASLNDDFYCLDLSGSISRTLQVRELTDILFPSRVAQPDPTDVQESWDAAEAPSLPPQLLPNLTHLSLAVDPFTISSGGRPPSWKHLLSLASRLPTLTHLSLAYWPEPSLTPNAKFSTVTGPSGRSVQYSGTGPYAHTLDDDWSEAVILLRRLSRSFYGLEYLDLTGCGSWIPALMHDQDGDRIDWEVAWGKITTLTLRDGYGVAEDTLIGDKERVRQVSAAADSVGKHIVAKRAGKGRFIEIDRDPIAP